MEPKLKEVHRTDAKPTDGDSSALVVSETLVVAEDLAVCYRSFTRPWRRLLGRSRRTTPQDRDPRRDPDGSFWALRDIDLSWSKGQCVGILGRNGAGKTTLCMALSGILPPDKGSVRRYGRATALLSLGAGFNPWLTGRQNVELNAVLMGVSRAEITEKMDQILEFSGLGPFADQPVRFYSSGMRARLGFSAMSILEPEILILDEIMGVGDAAFQAKSKEKIHEIINGSGLVIVVSHALRFVRRLCTDCIVLEQGRIVDHGPARKVTSAYARALRDGTPLSPEAA